MPTIPMDALAEGTRLVGDRWSPLILAALLEGPRRYGDLARDVPGISSNVLAQRLAALERNRLVVAEPYSRRPVRMRYALTETGAELAPALAALAAWGGRFGPGGQAEPVAHDVCGTPLDLRWHCSTCDVDVDVVEGRAAPGTFLA
ncbi:MAG TPA: helix-turn-helix domain-containing protein [Baekduia sp.]